MKWTDVKEEITSISPEDKNLIELMALLASIRREKNITQQSTVFSHETLPSFNNWLIALFAGAILVLISIGVVYYHVKNHKN